MNKINYDAEYESLFCNSEDKYKTKAEAFDKIAKLFYYGNFGSTQKSDLETLMFSIYLDRILDTKESDYSAYSDYRLSKILGISQTRISNLKIKKELKYPYVNFDWKRSFIRILGNAKLEDEKIKMYVPDTNLYIEIKNALEESGNYVDVLLNKKVLQVRPEDFLDLIIMVSDENNQNIVKESIKKSLDNNQKNIKYLTSEPFSTQLKNNFKDFGIKSLAGVVAGFIPVIGDSLKEPLENLFKSFL